MKFYTFSIIAILIFGTINSLSAQNTPTQKSKVALDNTEQFSIESKYVANEKYLIQVGLPNGYYNSTNSYPVLYILDGDKSFGMTKEITDWLTWDNEIKNVIVVGISYGKGTGAWWQKRARDYTPYKDTVYYYYPNSGDADKFLNFIRKELFPAIDQNYRTKKDSNAIVGLSFGALLSSYALFTQPDMFKSYIIISPSLFWNDNSILKTEAIYYNKHKDLNKIVYVAYGSADNNDWVIDPTKEFIHAVEAHKYEGLKFATQIFNGETHISVFPVALTHGLKNIFRR